MQQTPRITADDTFFLPDFCALPVVFAVVLMSELFAFIVTLASPGPSGFWVELALTSLFVQWVALTGAAVLCRLRPYLRPLDTRAAAIIAWLVIIFLVGLFSGISLRLSLQTGVELAKEFMARNLAIGAIVSGIVLRYFYVQHQWEQRLKTESEARIQALQARIRPHFLFNSMNTIASLTRTDSAAAETAIEDLSDLFRASLAEGRHLIPLEDELDLCRRYLHMEQFRLGDRLQVTWDIEHLPADVLLPPLTLQPLLENAVYHGIEPLAAGGTIDIRGSCTGDVLTMKIENPMPVSPSATPGHRMAVENIRERLDIHFGKAARLETCTSSGRYSLELILPLKSEAA